MYVSIEQMSKCFGEPGFSLRKKGPTGNMEREKLRRLIGIGCFGMNAFLKYVHAEAFSCNMYACMCLYVYLYVHGRIA